MSSYPKPTRRRKGNFSTVRICKADAAFSDFIRLRDKKCQRCNKPGTPRKADGMPVKHLQCSHFFGRRKESTRFDPENCDALCARCHQIWGSEDFESYREFKINQIGKDRFNLLRLKSNTPGKRDRGAELLIAKDLIAKLKGAE